MSDDQSRKPSTAKSLSVFFPRECLTQDHPQIQRNNKKDDNSVCMQPEIIFGFANDRQILLLAKFHIGGLVLANYSPINVQVQSHKVFPVNMAPRKD